MMPQFRWPLLPLSLFVISGGVWSCTSSQPPRAPATPPAMKALAPIPMPTPADTRPMDYPGVHNVVAYQPGYLSGSQPEGDSGFDTLAAMGIKTIISVDGAAPEVEKAASRGMRYIHLPISYNGIGEERGLELTRATRDAMRVGPVYIHCHHGKHRSAGAAAMACVHLGWSTPEQGVARMKVSGTSPNYTGLYACAQRASLLDEKVIDAVSADFPEISKPTDFVQGMVDVDHAFEHLKEIEKAGWKTPESSPDLVPAAEAGRLADLYRSLQETRYVKEEPVGLTELLRDAHAQAHALEEWLAAGEQDGAKLSAQFKLVAASCKDCHVKFRD
ncbi:MAG: cytochrome c [Phycisphaerae bacterium]|nr:cytochrome c [Phycisphaerae bacterium]